MQVEHHPTPRLSVPVGFHFTPKPEELVDGYLVPWIAGEPLADGHDGIVCHGDVYGGDPAALTDAFRDSAIDGNWYFLCVRRSEHQESGVRRSVDGGGAWMCVSGGRRDVLAGGGCFRKVLAYRDAANSRTRWMMEEFSSGLEAATDAAGEKVICKVFKAGMPCGRAIPAIVLGGGQVGAKRRRQASCSDGGTSAAASSDAGASVAAPLQVVCRRGLPGASTSIPAGGGQDGHGAPVAGARPAPLTMVSANGEELRFAQADGVEVAIDVAAMSELLDRVLSLNISGGVKQ